MTKYNYDETLQISLKISEIIVPDLLSRTIIDEEKLEELKISINQVGLINPITVNKIDNQYVLCAGYRRYLACKSLNIETIKASVLITDQTTYNQIMIDENFARADLSFLEEAVFLSSIMKSEKLSQKDLAKKIGKSEAFISERLAILTFDEEIIAALQTKDISLRVASILMKCNSKERRLSMLSQIIDSGASEKIVGFWVNDANVQIQNKQIENPESEFIPSEPVENVPDICFCEICETRTSYLSSRFIRVCDKCITICKDNLGPRNTKNSEH